jgi:hypothetical protein
MAPSQPTNKRFDRQFGATLVLPGQVPEPRPEPLTDEQIEARRRLAAVELTYCLSGRCSVCKTINKLAAEYRPGPGAKMIFGRCDHCGRNQMLVYLPPEERPYREIKGTLTGEPA